MFWNDITPKVDECEAYILKVKKVLEEARTEAREAAQELAAAQAEMEAATCIPPQSTPFTTHSDLTPRTTAVLYNPMGGPSAHTTANRLDPPPRSGVAARYVSSSSP